VNSLFYSEFAWGIDRKPSTLAKIAWEAGEGSGRAGISRLDWRRWHWRGRDRLNDLCRVISDAILNRIDMLLANFIGFLKLAALAIWIR
jgi:hypothetical protein